jgi:large subunit ribosomal protein L2
LGSVNKLGDIPEGMPVYNVESYPGDGGKYVRSAGSSAYIASHIGTNTTISMPSKAMVTLSNECRAQLGIVAGGGMADQPLVKAGKNHYIMRAINRTWPVLRGVKMNPVDHPYGGKQHHKGKSSNDIKERSSRKKGRPHSCKKSRKKEAMILWQKELHLEEKHQQSLSVFKWRTIKRW